MNSYYIIHHMDKVEPAQFRSRFLELSSQMARELLYSIPGPLFIKEKNKLKSVLLSGGYYARKMTPIFRRKTRSLGRMVRNQTVFDDLKVREVHPLSKGEGIKLAIIDTGIDPTIYEIRTRTKTYKNFLDGSKPIGEKGKFPYDWTGHGTSMTSLIYQVAPKVEFMIIKFYDQETMQAHPPTRWTRYLAAAGIIWAVRNGADVINLSASFLQDTSAVEQASKFCWEQNVVLITSMGNSNKGPYKNNSFFPAYYPWTMAIGGVEKKNGKLQIWEHSGRGRYIDVVAPAKDIWVEIPSYLDIRRRPRRAYGNSLASSLVAGTAALILSAMDKQIIQELKATPGRLVEAVRSILRETASNKKLGYEGLNPASGYGMINVKEAVSLSMTHFPYKFTEKKIRTYLTGQ
jgi:subtilisin family serine protease